MTCRRILGERGSDSFFQVIREARDWVEQMYNLMGEFSLRRVPIQRRIRTQTYVSLIGEIVYGGSLIAQEPRRKNLIRLVARSQYRFGFIQQNILKTDQGSQIIFGMSSSPSFLHPHHIILVHLWHCQGLILRISALMILKGRSRRVLGLTLSV